MDERLALLRSASPPIVATFCGSLMAQVFAAYFARLDVWSRRRRRYAVLIDLSRCAPASAAEHAWILDGIEARRAGCALLCAGTAIVVPSSSLGDGATAKPWINPFDHPRVIVPRREEGRELCARWARDCAAPRLVAPPEHRPWHLTTAAEWARERRAPTHRVAHRVEWVAPATPLTSRASLLN
jgi:hypothetical protein